MDFLGSFMLLGQKIWLQTSFQIQWVCSCRYFHCHNDGNLSLLFPIANRWASIIAEKQYNKGLFGGHK
jgi:hypothetical protein